MSLQRELPRPLLSRRQRGVDNVLLGDAYPVAQQLGDDGNVAGILEFTAFLPDQQRTGARAEPLAKACSGSRLSLTT